MREEAASPEEFSLLDDAFCTCVLIVVNVIVFVVYATSGNPEGIAFQWGLIPNQMTQVSHFPTLITSMFLHADVLHIFFNMFVLLLFGAISEPEIGPPKFLVLYFASGIAAGLFHTLFEFNSGIPTIGASGAIFGVVAGAAILSPHKQMRFLEGGRLDLLDGVVILFVIETLYAFSGVTPNIAHMAHIGGGIGGVLAIAALSDNGRETLKSVLRLHDAYYEEGKEI